MEPGTLYVVATPIGHLDDISQRALTTLKSVNRILAEDTRHTRRLLSHFGIQTPLSALHDHNERQQIATLVKQLEQGEDIALVSDAGTPLISDPGFLLIRAAHQNTIPVKTIPGPCSVVAALSVCGVPTDRFIFEGFLHAKKTARINQLSAFSKESRTIVFLETPHRIQAALEDMCEVFGPERQLAIARELTKTFESTRVATLGQWCKVSDTLRGEMVLVLSGYQPTKSPTLTTEQERVFQVLLESLSLKQASELAAKITGAKKKAFYEFGLSKDDKG